MIYYHLPMVYETGQPHRPMGFLQRHEPTDIPPVQPEHNHAHESQVPAQELYPAILQAMEHLRGHLDLANRALFNNLIDMVLDYAEMKENALVLIVDPDTGDFRGASFRATINHTHKEEALLKRAIAEATDNEIREFFINLSNLLSEPLRIAQENYDHNKELIEEKRTGNEVCPATS